MQGADHIASMLKLCCSNARDILRPNFTSDSVHGLAFGTPKCYIAPYGEIKHGLVSLSSNYDVKSGLRLVNVT